MKGHFDCGIITNKYEKGELIMINNNCFRGRFIYYTSDNKTIKYAAQELAKYLGRIGGYGYYEPIKDSCCNNMRNSDMEHFIRLGLFEELGIRSVGVEDASLDDEIHIDISEGCGIISGINPRSVLLAVYRMLSEIGCRWIRPGFDGELIPEVPLESINVYIHEKPSYRHRGIDFGGAKNREDVIEFIRWAPKLGFNSIFFEGINQWKRFFYRNRFSQNLGGSRTNPELFPESLLKIHFEEAVEEIKKLGLLYHGAGHGFTCLPFGIEPTYKGEVNDAISQHLALIDGKREIHHNGADTNLCMSNPETREIVTDYIVNYARMHPEIDFLHVWLADGIRNHCECENCKDTLPSDFYIKMLNELDEKLTKNNLDTRVVFISYIDLIWKPQKEKIKNEKRFILTHAPFYRTYNKSFNDVIQEHIPDIPPFFRNKNEYPVSIDQNASFILSWQKYFNRDSFMFDYHFWRAQYTDPGHFRIAKTIYNDIKSFKKFGLNGNMSCQVIKNFMTAGLGIYVMGKALWNENLEFEDIVKEYFDAAYGLDGEKCAEYFRNITKLLYFNIWNKKDNLQKKDAKRFEDAITYIESFREVIENNIYTKNMCHATSWKQLSIYSDILTLLALAWESKVLGNIQRMKSGLRFLELYVREHDDDLSGVFDDDAYLSWIKSIFC